MSDISPKEYFLWLAVPSLNAFRLEPDDIREKEEKFYRQHVRARFALQEFVRYVDSEPCQVPSPAIMAFLAEAFKEILEGSKAENALCLTKPRGRGPGARGAEGMKDNQPEELNRVRMVADVIALRKSGKSFEEAIEIVAGENLLSESTIKRAHADMAKRGAAIKMLAEFFGVTPERIKYP